MPKMSNRKKANSNVNINIHLGSYKTEKKKNIFVLCVILLCSPQCWFIYLYTYACIFWMPLVMVRARCPRLISQDPEVMSYNNLNIS